MRKLILPSLAFVTSMVLLGVLVFDLSHHQHEVIERSGETTVNVPQIEEYSIPDAGVDAGMEKVRPTPQQLVKEFLLFDLLDLEKQATNPEDKELIRKAIEIKRQKIKEAELSNDFEKNMQKALE